MSSPRPNDLDSVRVARARLFPSGAVITLRASRRDPAPGPWAGRLPVCPDADLDTATARAVLRHGGDREPIQVDALLEGEPDPVEVEPLERRQAELERRERAIERYSRSMQAELHRSWVDVEPPLEAWASFFDHHRRLRAELAEDVERIDEERRKKTADPGPRRAEVRLVVPPIPPAEHELEVEVSFRTSLARWRPHYEIHGAPGRSPEAPSDSPGSLDIEIEMALVAELEQSTGLDWSGVALTLCDREPPSVSGLSELRRIVVSGFQGSPLSPSEASEPVPPAPADVGPACTFVLPPGAGVPAPGDPPLRVELLRHRLQAQRRHRLRWEGPPTIERVAEAEASVDLPAADADAFWDGAYVGRGWVPSTRAGHPLELELGEVPQLRVHRRSERPPPRRSRGTNRLEHRFEVELEIDNVGAEPLDVDLRGQLPVAGSADVEVEIRALPEGTVVEPETGATASVLRLAGGARRRLERAFSIHAPRVVVIDPPEEA